VKLLLKKIQDVSSRVQELSYHSYTDKGSPELVAQLKILNGLLRTMVQVIGDPDQEQFVCERDDCPIHTRLKQFETIHYHIYHHMLFGPLARILGLVKLLQIEIAGNRYGKIHELEKHLSEETEALRNQITVILEAKNGSKDH